MGSGGVAEPSPSPFEHEAIVNAVTAAAQIRAGTRIFFVFIRI
jgi:hypothetical protein